MKPALGGSGIRSDLPGHELIRKGLRDLERKAASREALLVLIGAPRLRTLALDVPRQPAGSPEHRLYELLEREDAEDAHGRYNSLIRRLVSFERAAECVGLRIENASNDS